jgi:hypothetical protein
VVIERQELLSRTFVDAADTLVADFDILDFLTLLATRCVDLFGIGAAGMLLADPTGGVHLAAISSHRIQMLELFELQYDEGPCLDSYREGAVVRCDDLQAETDRWPRFAPEARRHDFVSAYAVPMRLRTQIIGSLNLLGDHVAAMDGTDLVVAQALADVATIGILQHRAAQEHQLLASQLQYALTSRIVVEQAKGVIAEHAGLDMDAAFNALRAYARNTNTLLADVARAVVERGMLPSVIVDQARRP